MKEVRFIKEASDILPPEPSSGRDSASVDPAKELFKKALLGRLEDKHSQIKKFCPPEPPPRYSNEEAEKRLENLDEGVMRQTRVFHEHDTLFSLARLVIELEKEIPNYDTILSDDASGRLISLFLREVINKKRKALQKEPVQTYFIAGGREHSNPKAIGEFIQKKKPSIGKALLVTEFISSGGSIGELVKILKEQGLDFDVAALSIRQDIGYYSNRPEFKDLVERLRYGDDSAGHHGVAFWAKPFTGVKKNKAGGAHPVKDPEADRWQMKLARRDIKIMAAEISKLIL